MNSFTDQTYLQEQQYPDSRNLGVRIALHQEFSTNQIDWFQWVFDHFQLPNRIKLLELGCGPGHLWARNASRVPSGWQIYLSDYSPGMVGEAQARLAGLPLEPAWSCLDAQRIPYPEDRFQAVIANHMLYHVPDRQQALAEIRRVLAPGGRLIASTVGRDHLVELKKLAQEFQGSSAPIKQEINPFTLESGPGELEDYFRDIRVIRQKNALHITRVEPLVDYFLSSFRLGMEPGDRDALGAFLKEKMTAAGGGLRIRKDNGLLTARVPDR